MFKAPLLLFKEMLQLLAAGRLGLIWAWDNFHGISVRVDIKQRMHLNCNKHKSVSTNQTLSFVLTRGSCDNISWLSSGRAGCRGVMELWIQQRQRGKGGQTYLDRSPLGWGPPTHRQHRLQLCWSPGNQQCFCGPLGPSEWTNIDRNNVNKILLGKRPFRYHPWFK